MSGNKSLRLGLPVIVAAAAVAACGSTGSGTTASVTATTGVAPTSASASPSQPPTPTLEWQIPQEQLAKDDDIEAYTAASSLNPGQPLDLYVSANGPVTVRAFRIGDYQGAGATEVYKGQPVPASKQNGIVRDPNTRAASAPWERTATIPTTGWQPGFYLVQISDGTKRRNVPMVVRSPDTKGKVVVVAGDTTWQAYNSWGGRSLYKGPDGFSDRAYAASFDRPYSSADWEIWFDFDIPVARAAERSGVPVAYRSVSDLALDPGALEGTLGVVSNGHDEYWPVPYRDALVKARDGGSNLAFLGANAGYWRVRLETTSQGPGRLVVGYKSAEADPVKNSQDTTARWRDSPDAKPENTVVGNYYDCYPSSGDMTIVRPEFFLFQGTGVTAGSQLPGLVGNETDRAYARADTPRPIEVPAISSLKCQDTTSYSTIAYYTVPSGAGVFAAGTMSWTRGLTGVRPEQGLTQASADFTTKVTDTLFKQMAAGPMGKAHPATDDWQKLAALGDANHAGD